MGPRANFECKTCQATYPDLPVQSIACPVCRKKRGFRRLFDAVNVAASAAPARVLDQLTAPIQAKQEAQQVPAERRSLALPAAAVLGAVGAPDRGTSRALFGLGGGGGVPPVFAGIRGGGPVPRLAAPNYTK
jgi:hypothetical protein